MPKYKIDVTMSMGWGIEIDAPTECDAEYRAEQIVARDLKPAFTNTDKSITYRGINEQVINAHEVKE